LHREASILLPEQFEDWDKAKVNVIIVPLFACLANINEETGSEELEQETLLSLDNIPSKEGEESLLSLDNNSPLQELWDKAMEADQQLVRLTETVQLNKPWFSEEGVKVSISECSLNANGELCFQD
jgi:hypothetical protein